MKLSIIICVYNERKTILEAIHQAHAVDLGADQDGAGRDGAGRDGEGWGGEGWGGEGWGGEVWDGEGWDGEGWDGEGWEKEIVVVDNYSTDGTRELLQSIDLPGVRVIFHPRNLGKGASVRTGIAEARGDYFVVFDADLEYEADDLSRLVEAVVPDKTVAVFGSRTLGGRRIYKYARNYWGVRFLSAVTNLLYGSRLTDVAVGLKLVRLDVARSLQLDGSDFDLDFELPCKLLKQGHDISEVPIAYHPRTFEEGKKLKAFHAGPGALWAIVRVRFVD